MNRFTSALRRSGPAPTIILDLDETILYRTRGLVDTLALYAPVPSRFSSRLGLRVGTPYPHAVESIRSLSAQYRFVSIVGVVRFFRGRSSSFLQRGIVRR